MGCNLQLHGALGCSQDQCTPPGLSWGTNVKACCSRPQSTCTPYNFVPTRVAREMHIGIGIGIGIGTSMEMASTFCMLYLFICSGPCYHVMRCYRPACSAIIPVCLLGVHEAPTGRSTCTRDTVPELGDRRDGPTGRTEEHKNSQSIQMLSYKFHFMTRWTPYNLHLLFF